jgi:hypothetical protein
MGSIMTRKELLAAVERDGRVHFKNGDTRPLRAGELRLVQQAIMDAWPAEEEA